MAKTLTPAAYSDEPYTAIPMCPVESNKIKAVGYDEASKTLAVVFQRRAGAIYHYPDVQPQTYADFMAADSLGGFFGKNLQNLPFKKFRAPAVDTHPLAAEAART